MSLAEKVQEVYTLASLAVLGPSSPDARRKKKRDSKSFIHYKAGAPVQSKWLQRYLGYTKKKHAKRSVRRFSCGRHIVVVDETSTWDNQGASSANRKGRLSRTNRAVAATQEVPPSEHTPLLGRLGITIFTFKS